MDDATSLLTEDEVARRLGVSRRTLLRWRFAGDGPSYLRLGPKVIRYAEADVAAYIDARRRGAEARA